MESAALRRPPALPQLLRFGLLGTLVLLAVVAWAITDARMDGMDAGPGTELGTLGFFLTTWVVMMSAMMFPSISPMVLMYARMAGGQRERGKGEQAGETAFFVGGYLVAWAVAGLAGYAIFDLVRSLSIDALAWDRAGQYVAAGVLIGAAAYQLTPLKDACLRRCRNPLMFLLTSWRPGRAGALRMGAEHGAWCVGCCWALMAALFALGVMSIGWMALIAALIAAEKLLPRQALVSSGVAVLLLVLGIGLAVAPASVPGLTVPGSPEAMQSMDGSMEPMQGTGESAQSTPSMEESMQPMQGMDESMPPAQPSAEE
jgi:predicted metal-binding membrane protein